jgi:hypothetical protein
MKRLLLAGATIASLIATNAFAADLPAKVYTKAPPPVVAVYNWTGFYVGGPTSRVRTRRAAASLPVRLVCVRRRLACLPCFPVLP